MRTKKEYERAVKRSVSLPGILSDKAEEKQRQRGLTKFSDYIQMLIRRDVGFGEAQ